MKKYEIWVNNVEKVAEFLTLDKIQNVKMNGIFSNSKLKELSKKIPKGYDKESIRKFEEDTGLIVKYYVFNNKYEFFEYNHFGIYPDNDATIIDEDGNKKYNLKSHYLENFDILVVDKISKFKK